ncbi:T9SS type B sorting domain-containing protein [Parachryseolinea silvisoli]|uniref:T9SS type B sorting domain-containing protein n=1 Tax=Parachryseolinea silvisoli TaxID=2873601 RepID=UPI002265D71F|nr:gliding motility-associated C-terminal domain-containing protein [Parachryseolinea silvisoli]MCD9018715.1 gliding motility-associated C-terminal domain-containing protein [Parachryseolinea silvisoli]
MMKMLSNLPQPFTAFRGAILLVVCLVAMSPASAQCNTALKKLLAEKSVNNDDRFGSALAASERYMVVGAESSDTLGILYAGAAYVYEKTPAGWAYRALLTASDPDEYDFFGNDVAIDDTGNTIVVVNRRYTKGTVYIFEKPASGWESMHETARVVLPDYLEYTAAVDITDDGSRIAVSGNQYTTSEFYTLDRPGTHWTSGTTPQKTVFAPPDGTNISSFGMDIVIQGEYIYASADNGDVGIHVFKRNGTTYQHIAKLSISVPFGQTGYFGRYITVLGDQIATTGAVSELGNAGMKLFVFKKNGEWADAVETAQIKTLETRQPYFPVQFISPTEIAASIFYQPVGEEEYTGELQIVTTQDGTWQHVNTEVIFQQTGLNAFAEFDAQLAWSGTDLIRSISAAPTGGGRSAAVSLTRSMSLPDVWGSLQYVLLPRQSSSNVNFGSAVLRTPEALFASAPYDDTMGKDAGAVYIYEKMGEDFVKTHTIFPSARKTRPTGGSDNGFGYSLAIHDKELAVGATGFRNNATQSGKIFLYRRTGASWTSATLYDSLIAPPALELTRVGTAMVMNDTYLFASAYNNFNGEHTNGLLVYEKIAGKWTFQQLLKIGRPLDKSWPSLRLSLYENQLVVGSYFTVAGGVTIFEKNPGTGNWEPQHFLPGEIPSGFGADVKLESGHLFVGVPAYDFQGVAKSGAVFIYTRLPGETWNQVTTPSAIVGAKVPVEGGYFGSSLDVIGNTLVVGAPGKFLTNDSQVRTVPGNTYVIQAEDYFWTRQNQFLILQGDRYASQERDHFGADVGVDEEYFYIGARNENSATGMFSGAVYYIPTPPVLFLHPPVCIGSGPIQLEGYPFNGTWTGPGIEDPAGRFNPAVAGEGISTLIYTTPSCHHQGTIQITVTTPAVLQQLSPAAVTLCNNPVTLRVGPSSTPVQWFYQPTNGGGYTSLGVGGPSRQVTNPGQYYARTSDAECPVESDIFTLSIENFSITLGPQEVICDASQAVSLNTSNAAGTWEGQGVAGGQFNPAGLTNGTYRLTYRITTPGGCSLALKDSVKINIVAPFVLTRIPEDYCETGAATLQAQTAESLDYTWYYGETVADMQPVNKPLQATAVVYDPGYYYASATNGECTGQSDIVSVGFSDDLSYTLLPEENSTVTLCSAEEFTLAVQSRAGVQYTWEYKIPQEDSYRILSGTSGPEMTVRENGVYRVNGRYGFCSFASQPVSVEFSEDVFYVPNVFTPNDDTYNNVFKAETTYAVTNLRIINRYGQEVHANAAGIWDGGNVGSGTYFWIVTYTDCEQREMTAKGWVQVVK